MIERLPVLLPPQPGRPTTGGAEHPMRQVTRQVAFSPDSWTPERAAKVATLFDGMAAGWDERDAMMRYDALEDALTRGGLPAELRASGRGLELGSGTGLATRVLRPQIHSIVALDLSFEMLVRAPAARGARVLADAAALPLPSASAVAMNIGRGAASQDRHPARTQDEGPLGPCGKDEDAAGGDPGRRTHANVCGHGANVDVVVLVNALLFPGEIDRVLRSTGHLVWVSSLGENTPIYLPVEDVVAALPGSWNARGSAAGWGTWGVLRRAGRDGTPSA